MNSEQNNWLNRYRRALEGLVHAAPHGRTGAAARLGREATRLKLETLDVARVHESALAAMSASARNAVYPQAEAFFIETIGVIEKSHIASVAACAHLGALSRALHRRTAALERADRHLREGIARRKNAAKALKSGRNLHAVLLRKSNALQEDLRNLTRRILAAQESKRTSLSRTLQNEIAQTLIGINVRLLALKRDALLNAAGLHKEIVSTQRLVGQSARMMKGFCRGYGNKP